MTSAWLASTRAVVRLVQDWARPAKCHSIELFSSTRVDDDDAVRARDVRNARILVGRGVVTAEIQTIDGVRECHALRVVRPGKYEQHLRRRHATDRWLLQWSTTDWLYMVRGYIFANWVRHRRRQPWSTGARATTPRFPTNSESDFVWLSISQSINYLSKHFTVCDSSCRIVCGGYVNIGLSLFRVSFSMTNYFHLGQVLCAIVPNPGDVPVHNVGTTTANIHNGQRTCGLLNPENWQYLTL